MDDALNGACSAVHLTALAEGLPPTARIFAASDEDLLWTSDRIMLADVRNHLAMILWTLGGGKGKPKPQLVGPSWMRGDNRRKLDARVMTADELMLELSKPRGGGNG